MSSPDSKAKRSPGSPELPPTAAPAVSESDPSKDEADWLRFTLESDRALLASIVESSDDAIISKTLDGVILSWNNAAERIFGYTAEEAIGNSVTLIIPPDRIDEERTILQKLREGERIEHYETVRVGKDGRLLDVSLTVSPIRNKHGQIVGASKVGRDITEKKRAERYAEENERRLRETADRLALAMAAAQLGDWSWDARTDEVTLSERAAEIFGVPRDAQRTWTELQRHLHPDDRERIVLTVEDVVASKKLYNVEYRVIRPDGAVAWVLAIGRVMFGSRSEPLGMFGVVQDVTDRKRQEEELRQRAVELAEADRKKDDFIALLAHELRNPLAPVRTGLEVIRLAGGGSEAMEQARTMMDRQLTHMVRLIDDLLDVSRVNRSKLNLQKSKVSLSAVVNDAIDAAMPAIEAASHSLTVSLPPEPVMLDADLTRLAQVFGNLLSNCAKYTSPGGKISLTAVRQGNEVEVAVRDNGIGIPEEALPHIFEMFSQVDRVAERTSGGLGIGLALVKGLIEMHGGTVAAASEGLGKGSTFTVRLPIVPSGGASRSERAVPGSRVVPTFRKVLVVDDNRDGAESMATMLSLLGNEVTIAHDGVKAVEAAERIRPNLILMDVGMPVMDGLAATRKIRQLPWSSDVTIIALTGWGQEGDRDRSRAAGCDGHLVKPVSLAELEAVLKEVASN